MTVKPKLLFINPCQFGYLTDMYKWCKYLKDDYDITVLCFDSGLKRQELEGINIHYVSYGGAYYVRGVRFFLTCLKTVLFFNGIVFVEYFKSCEWLKRLLPVKKMILDIRTAAVLGTQAERDTYDKRLEQACDRFDIVSVISEGVRRRLKRDDHTFILPLGADIISSSEKRINNLKLLYVGTFDNRQIDKTIMAVSAFHNQHPDIPITYDIVGNGNHGELELYRKLVKELDLCDIVTLYGRIPNAELKPYFDKANVGVSFVPITDYYDIQPPTKTFEYTLSGLYTIATRTTENARVINQSCGILIDDTEEDFVKALEYIWAERGHIDSSIVRAQMIAHKWEIIVERFMVRILNQYRQI